jgi:hypothetical protein
MHNPLRCIQNHYSSGHSPRHQQARLSYAISHTQTAPSLTNLGSIKSGGSNARNFIYGTLSSPIFQYLRIWHSQTLTQTANTISVDIVASLTFPIALNSLFQSNLFLIPGPRRKSRRGTRSRPFIVTGKLLWYQSRNGPVPCKIRLRATTLGYRQALQIPK